MWNRRDVDFIDSDSLAWTRIPDSDLGSVGGGLRKVLSCSTTGANTQLLTFRKSQRGVLSSAVDFYVFKGSGTINGQMIGLDDYVYIPEDASIEIRPNSEGLVLYAGFWGPASIAVESTGFGRLGEVEVVSPSDIQWRDADWAGDMALEPGAMVKSLRREDDGSHVYLAAMMPGWRCEEEESHPVYEESFKIYGDVLMGPLGVMQRGSYFYRSPNVFHGPMYSRGGTMSFIRSNGITTTTYRPVEESMSWCALDPVRN